MANITITGLTAESSVASTDVLAFVDLSVAATRKATIENIVIGGGGITATSSSTLTNKTLTSPIISTISNTGTLTLPTITDTIVGRATTDTLTNKTLTSPNLNNSDLLNIRLAEFNGEVDNGNSSTADTINWGTGNFQKSTLTGNCTYTFTAPSGFSRLTLRLLTGSGGFAVTWPAAVKWTAGTAPTITTTASKVDIVTFIYDGTNYWGTYSQNYTA